MSERPLTGKNIEELLSNIVAGDRFGDGAARQLVDEIRAFMQSRERREEALRAVVRTAADIINVLNVSDVFDAAVARAQALVRSDIAYLAVFDEASGRTCVRGSIGVKSPEFNELNVPVGVGIGGVVARSKEPFLTADYISDTNLLHLASVDQGIAAEGIRAMAGVPLIARGEFTGALFVSDRYVRSYTPEEVSDLQALGVLVTVAIENAKLFEAKEKGLREIQSAYDSLRIRIATTERIAGMHDQLAGIVSRGASVSELVSGLAEELNVDMILRDATGHLLASHFHDPSMQQRSLSGPRVEAALKRSIKSGMLEPLPDTSQDSESQILAIAVGDELHASLAIITSRALLGSERRTLERGGHAVGLLLLQRGLAMSRDLERRGQLLADCIAGGKKWRDLRERSSAMGLDIEQPALVAAFDAGPIEYRELLRRLAQSVVPEKILPGIVRGCVVAILPDYDIAKLNVLAKKLSDSLAIPVSVGFEHCDEPVSMAAIATGKAIHALQTAMALGKHGAVDSLANLAGEAVLLRGNSPDELSAYVSDTIGVLQRYDLERTADLVATLRQYFLSNQNVSNAASALKIHVKTMSQRLERITQLLGDDWRDSRRLLQIQLAIRLNELMGDLPRHSPG